MGLTGNDLGGDGFTRGEFGGVVEPHARGDLRGVGGRRVDRRDSPQLGGRVGGVRQVSGPEAGDGDLHVDVLPGLPVAAAVELEREGVGVAVLTDDVGVHGGRLDTGDRSRGCQVEVEAAVLPVGARQ